MTSLSGGYCFSHHIFNFQWKKKKKVAVNHLQMFAIYSHSHPKKCDAILAPCLLTLLVHVITVCAVRGCWWHVQQNHCFIISRKTQCTCLTLCWCKLTWLTVCHNKIPNTLGGRFQMKHFRGELFSSSRMSVNLRWLQSIVGYISNVIASPLLQTFLKLFFWLVLLAAVLQFFHRLHNHFPSGFIMKINKWSLYALRSLWCFCVLAVISSHL